MAYSSVTYSSLSPGRVLVVEDHAACRLVTTTYLEMNGCSYDVAEDGEEAVEKAMTGNYSSILMDVKLRKMDGIEATRRIRAYERSIGRPPVRIVAVTALALLGDQHRCLSSGMDDYISKPYAGNELKKKLKKLGEEPRHPGPATGRGNDIS